MAKCVKCGNVVPDGQQTCPVCGAVMYNAGNQNYSNQNYQNPNYQNQAYTNQGYTNQGYTNQGYQNQQYQNQGYQNQQYTNSNLEGSDTTYMYDPMDIQQNKAMAVLSYIGILCLIPLLSNHTSRYARFHTVQGLNLFILGLAISIITRVGNIFFSISLITGAIWTMVTGILGLAVFVFAIMGIVNAVQGKAKELPLIGQIHLIQLF